MVTPTSPLDLLRSARHSRPLFSTILILALLVTSWPALVSASVVDLFGYGARGAAMAGTVVSHSKGHEGVYYNPASLAFERRPTFAVGFQRGDFLLEINEVELDVQNIPALVVGFGAPIPFGGWMKNRLTLGLGLLLPQSSILIADLPRPGTESFILVENRAQTVSIQGAVGVRAADWLSVGVGFIALAELVGAIEVAPNDEGQIGSEVKDEVIANYATIIGLLIKPTDWLSVGLTYHGESVARFSIPITADLGEDFTLPIPLLNLAGIAQYDPRQVSAEVSVQPRDDITIGIGATWKQWSAFPSPIEYTAVPEGFPAQPEPGFEDTITPRIGGEWRIELDKDWRLSPRAGLAFEPTPAPEQTGDQNYLDNNRVIVAAGLEVAWQSISLALVGQWHTLPERTSTKDPDSLDETVLEDNPGLPSISHKGDILFWGFELGLEL